MKLAHCAPDANKTPTAGRHSNAAQGQVLSEIWQVNFKLNMKTKICAFTTRILWLFLGECLLTYQKLLRLAVFVTLCQVGKVHKHLEEPVRRKQQSVTRDPETMCMQETMRGKVIKKRGEAEKGWKRQEKSKKERKKEQWKVAANSSISKPLCRNSLCLPSPSH